MMPELEKISIDLFGTNIKILSNEDPSYVNELIEYIREKSETLSSTVRLQDPLKISILTALSISDEFMTYKRSIQSIKPFESETDSQVEKEVEEITSRLIRQIDQVLIED